MIRLLFYKLAFFTILSLLSVLNISCINSSEKGQDSCRVYGIDTLSILNDRESSLNNIDSFVTLLFSEIKCDTIFVFKPYSNKDSIHNLLKCYDRKLDTIAYDDRYYLFVFKEGGDLRYKYIDRGDLVLTNNSIYPSK